eukprot:SAG25_NODE_188_length_12354_cov_23.716116_5_plen_572_part_00
MRHFLNNIEVAPKNIFEFGLRSTFNGDPSILQMDADKVILPREAKTIIDQHVQTLGLFEGIPYRIEMENNVSLEYYVDLTDGAIFRDFEIEVKVKKRKGYDDFWERAQGTSFELMNEKGVIFPLIDIPYLIIRDNQLEVGLTLGVALYSMTDALVTNILQSADLINDVIEAVTPNASLPPVPPIGEIITMVLKALIQVAYTIALLIAVIKLAQQMFDLIFPKIRYYKGCTVKNLIETGCDFLGFTVDSTLLNNLSQLTIMPVPITKEKNSIWDYLENDLNFSFTKGYPTAQDSTPTLGNLIDFVENTYNARTRVFNGTVQIERRDFWESLTTNSLLPALNLQDDRQSEFQYNTDEAWKRTYIHYLVDYSDIHTVDFFDPTDAEYSTEALNVINPDLITIKGLNDVAIPFALGVRKTKLNFIEKLAKEFFITIDDVVTVFGGNSNYASSIGNRVGITQISQQFYSQSKLLYASAGRQPENYVDLISAKAIYNDYHKINNININGYKIISNAPIRLRPAEFVNLYNNNYANINGLLCEIITIQYNDAESKAVISYKQPNSYALGKVEIIAINE